eukprot:5567805-Amphidinium_carterae.1
MDENLEFIVDSGASESVIPPDFGSAPLQRCDGKTFTNASKNQLKALGTKSLRVQLPNSNGPRSVKCVVLKVHRALLSVSKMVDNDHTVVFKKSGSFILDGQTNERIPLERKDG